MNIDLASALNMPGFVNEYSRKSVYGLEMSAEERELDAALQDHWKDIGRSGFDKDHELAALIMRTVTPEIVTPAGELLSRMFNEGSIGEFDDTDYEVGPKNTLVPYEAILGGNVKKSYIDHSRLTPTWKSLQIRTEISYQELRRNGYKNVANLVNWAREAFEVKRVALVFAALSAAISSGAANYINETSTAPTDTSMAALQLYLSEVSDGSAPIAFGLNKYIQAVGNLTNVNTNKTDVEKGLWNSTGYVKNYAGVELIGFSALKKFPDNTTVVPDKTLFGVAGKIGNLDMKGELNVYETPDNDSEKLTIKMNGYTFGYCITDITKVAKMVIA
jgi:hypothetical protein